MTGNLFEPAGHEGGGGAEDLKTLYLVDASSLLYRSFFAVRNLTTRDGRPTNAIFGTLKMAQKLLRDHRPEFVAFVFDLPAPTFRHEAFAAYKANRPETPRDLQVQVPPAKEILRAMGLPVLDLEGYEADDIIGTLVQKASAAGMESVIVTADKDLFQLVRPGVRILHTKKEDALLDSRGVEEVFGVPPERVVDVLALWGDPTDNIPGVPGIGEKGAKELVRQYGPLEEVLAHAGEVTRKAYREGLLQNAEQARFSRQLATVCTDAPVPWEVSALRPEEPDRDRLSALYREYQFTSLLQEVGGAPAAESLRGEASDLDPAALARLLAAPSAGFAWDGDTVWLSDGEAVWCGPRLLLAPEPFARLSLCAHDLKPFLRVAGAAEYRPGPGFLDAAVAGYMLDPSGRVPSLATLAERFLNARCDEGDRASQALLLARVAVPLRERLAALGMEAVWAQVERPLVSALARMEAVGIRVDVPYFRELGASMGEALARLEREIHASAGVEFNPASPKQVGEVLFDKLMLPVQKKTSKTRSYSTDGEVLETLREAHPVVPLLLEHRMLAKLKGTYADPLPSYADSAGRLHAEIR
jgi:DNA polymerase-1